MVKIQLNVIDTIIDIQHSIRSMIQCFMHDNFI